MTQQILRDALAEAETTIEYLRSRIRSIRGLDRFHDVVNYTTHAIEQTDEAIARITVALATADADQAPKPAKRRDVFAICDAYESGIGHGLQLDFHKSGAIFGNPECGKAYEIGYEEGEERARSGKAVAPAAPIGEVPGLAERYSDVLRELACYVGAGGHNSEGMIDPAIAKAKIEWGIDELVRNAPKSASNAEAAQFCRDNGLNVPAHWETHPIAEQDKPEPVELSDLCAQFAAAATAGAPLTISAASAAKLHHAMTTGTPL